MQLLPCTRQTVFPYRPSIGHVKIQRDEHFATVDLVQISYNRKWEVQPLSAATDMGATEWKVEGGTAFSS
jgi:hypothetical protein